MPRLPRISGEEAWRALQRDGWTLRRVTGSHHHLTHPDRRGVVTIPVHAGKTLHPKVLKSILDQAGVSVDRLWELL